jgi:uncharacterized protein (TIGR00106 family)
MARTDGEQIMVLLEFAIAPTSEGESLSRHVARILDIVDRSGVPYRLTAMGTILEGDWDVVIGVVADCFRALQVDCHRISLNLKMDYRAGTESRLESKIDAVEGHVGRKLRT